MSPKLVVIFISFSLVRSYNILGIFTVPSKSHSIVYTPLMKALAEQGHKVTVVTSFPAETEDPNYRNVDISDSMRSLVASFPISDVNCDDKFIRYWILPHMILKTHNEDCENSLLSKNLRKFLGEKQEFDVVIMEYFGSDCFLGVLDKFNAPVIGFSTQNIPSWVSPRFANPTNPAYIPNSYAGFHSKMSFTERLENTLLLVIHRIMHWYYMNQGKKVIRKHISEGAAQLEKFIQNSSLLLVNSHFSLNFPTPLAPNIIEVGGIHLGQPKPLKKDLLEWIEESSDGIIYFSLGSMIQSSSIPEANREMFMNAFNRFPQRIIWKEENESDEYNGKIYRDKWISQFDVLCHPNVKLFISHGGQLSIMEAVHCGVPLILIPQLGDQYTNAKSIEGFGAGTIVNFSEMTEEVMYQAILKGLNESSSKNMEELSERFRDRPRPPMEEALYWIQYVIRHKGAPHMRSAAVDMPFYQYHLLDVFLVIAIILVLITYSMFFFVRRCISLLLSFSHLKKHKKD